MGGIVTEMFRLLLIKLFYYTGMAFISRKVLANKGKFILMFHGVSMEKIKGIDSSIQPHLSKDEFESILCWLKKNFDFLHPRDLSNSEKSGLLITFDDGFHNNYSNVLPLLNKYEIPGLFFVSTQHIENPKNWMHFIKSKIEKNCSLLNLNEDVQSDLFDGISKEDLAMMASNQFVTIGSHTISHPLLSKCSKEEINKELINSKKYLEKISGQSVDYFSYPSGDYDIRVLKIIGESGYKNAFGIDKINNLGQSKFEIPRIGIYSHKKPYLAAKLSGLYVRPLNLSF